ncbi:hypothetical protein ACKKBF_B21475 [Auxenochlorella protothecoides x Auxenochlorella symbiontica]
MGVLDAWSNSGAKYGDDLESGGGLLYPGIDATDNSLRWGFVRKVYGIVTIQLALTAAVALVVTLVPSVNAFLARSLAANIGLMVLSLLALIPLFIYKDRHPLNLALLGLWPRSPRTPSGPRRGAWTFRRWARSWRACSGPCWPGACSRSSSTRAPWRAPSSPSSAPSSSPPTSCSTPSSSSSAWAWTSTSGPAS